MKIGSAVLLAGAGLIIYRLYRTANAGALLRYTIKSVKHAGSNLGSSRFNLTLAVQNPSNTNVQFNRFAGRVDINGNNLVDVFADGEGRGVYLKRNSTTDVVIPFTINHLQVAVNLKGIISAIVNKKPIEGLRLQGLLYAGGLEVPVNQNFAINFSKQNNAVGCATCKQVSGIYN